MSKRSALQQQHHDIDYAIIGVYAFDPETRHIAGVDGSMVICGTAEAMLHWLKANNLMQCSVFDSESYEALLEAMCVEAISFHMDALAFSRFEALRAKDQRFWPDIVSFTEDGWSYVGPSFDLVGDDPSEFASMINECAVSDPSKDEVLTYGEYKRLEQYGRAPELNEWERMRIESVRYWDRLLDEIRE